ncbi:hypothetical protein JEQ12_007641 [Ovis aries]|uniref:Protein FAM169B n=1 Tax=Ovis aries TaxID=9940 RepID=A0A836CWG5_SHEEP|nr:hypothetical protein JEQ12_007641 [Ovis aries]
MLTVTRGTPGRELSLLPSGRLEKVLSWDLAGRTETLLGKKIKLDQKKEFTVTWKDPYEKNCTFLKWKNFPNLWCEVVFEENILLLNRGHLPRGYFGRRSCWASGSDSGLLCHAWGRSEALTRGFLSSHWGTVVAVYVKQSWWTTEDVLRTSDPSREGLMKVQSFGERIVLFVLNVVIFGRLERNLDDDDMFFLPHSVKEEAKILWRDGAAVGFYTTKRKGSLCGDGTGTCYLLPVFDTVFVRRRHRRRGLALAMLRDFCQTFREDEALGVSWPISPAMYQGGRGETRQKAQVLGVLPGPRPAWARSSVGSRCPANFDFRCLALFARPVELADGAEFVPGEKVIDHRSPNKTPVQERTCLNNVGRIVMEAVNWHHLKRYPSSGQATPWQSLVNADNDYNFVSADQDGGSFAPFGRGGYRSSIASAKLPMATVLVGDAEQEVNSDTCREKLRFLVSVYMMLLWAALVPDGIDWAFSPPTAGCWGATMNFTPQETCLLGAHSCGEPPRCLEGAVIGTSEQILFLITFTPTVFQTTTALAKISAVVSESIVAFYLADYLLYSRYLDFDVAVTSQNSCPQQKKNKAWLYPLRGEHLSLERSHAASHLTYTQCDEHVTDSDVLPRGTPGFLPLFLLSYLRLYPANQLGVVPSVIIYVLLVMNSTFGGPVGMLVLPYSFLLPEQDVKPCPQSHMLFSDRTGKLSGRRKVTSPAFMMRPEIFLTLSLTALS